VTYVIDGSRKIIKVFEGANLKTATHAQDILAELGL